MNASQVMLHILFLEFFDIILYKLHHILFRVVGFLPQTLVGKHSQAAVTLQGTGRNLKQKTEILVVEQFFIDGRTFFLLRLSFVSQHQHVVDAVYLFV